MQRVSRAVKVQETATERGGGVRVSGGCPASRAAAAEAQLLVGEGERTRPGGVREPRQWVRQVSVLSPLGCNCLLHFTLIYISAIIIYKGNDFQGT